MSIGFSRWPAKPLARSQATPPSSASALKATTGIADVRGPFASFRAASAPSMSGNRRSIRMTLGRCSLASAILRHRSRLRASGSRLRAAHRALASRFFSLSSTMRTRGVAGVTSVFSAHADPARAGRGQLLGARRPPAAARDATRSRGRGRVRRSRLAARRDRRRGAGRRRHRHSHAPRRPGRGDPGRHGAARDAPGSRRRRAQPIREPELCARASRGGQRAAGVPPEGARAGSRATRRGNPRRRGGRVRDRPEGRRGARRGECAQSRSRRSTS